MPFLQASSPAALVASTLRRVLGGKDNVRKYTFVDFCAGAGGPTPEVERILNAQLLEESESGAEGGERKRSGNGNSGPVQFVLTDLHPHMEAWTAAAKKSDNLTFIADSVDAANAPRNLLGKDEEKKKVFRLFNLAFHHFDDPLAADILRNTLETADGFGFVFFPSPNNPPFLLLGQQNAKEFNRIFELQSRNPTSLVTVFGLGPLFTLLTPFYFYASPLHLFFTYIIPIIPFVLVVDGYVSSMRTRSAEEVLALLDRDGSKEKALKGWKIKSGQEMHTWPVGYTNWVIGVREN